MLRSKTEADSPLSPLRLTSFSSKEQNYFAGGDIREPQARKDAQLLSKCLLKDGPSTENHPKSHLQDVAVLPFPPVLARYYSISSGIYRRRRDISLSSPNPDSCEQVIGFYTLDRESKIKQSFIRLLH